MAHLALVPVDSSEFGNVRPIGSPGWVAMCPLTVMSLNKHVRNAILAEMSAGGCSRRTAEKLMREYRDAAA